MEFAEGGANRVEDVTDETWDRLVNINITSAMKCSRVAGPLMRASGGGAIFNVSSVAGALGLTGGPGAAAYASMKASTHGLTLSTAADYATESIRCNCIVIGSVSTPLVAKNGEEYRQRRIEMMPMQTEGTG